MTFIHDQQQFARNLPAAPPPELGVADRPDPILTSVADEDPISHAAPRDVVASQQFASLDVALTEEDRAFWCFMKPERRPSFTLELLADLTRVQRLIGSLFATPPAVHRRHSTMSSWDHTRRACSTWAAIWTVRREDPSW